MIQFNKESPKQWVSFCCLPGRVRTVSSSRHRFALTYYCDGIRKEVLPASEANIGYCVGDITHCTSWYRVNIMWVYTGYSRQPYNRYNTWIKTLIPKYHWPFTCWIQCIWKAMFNILLIHISDAWHLLRRNSWNVMLPVEFLSLNGQVISKLSASNEFRTAWAADVTDNCGLLWKRGIRPKIGTIEMVLGYWKISLLKYYAMRQKTKSA